MEKTRSRNQNIEDPQKRLERLTNGSPVEIIETLLNSLSNFLNNEINQAVNADLWSLAVLGIHAVALTISEGVYDKKGLTGFKFFLEQFMDEDKDGFRFSEIAQDIHNHRNVIAHRWLTASGYAFGFDMKMDKGWEKRGNTVFMNTHL